MDYPPRASGSQHSGGQLLRPSPWSEARMTRGGDLRRVAYVPRGARPRSSCAGTRGGPAVGRAAVRAARAAPRRRSGSPPRRGDRSPECLPLRIAAVRHAQGGRLCIKGGLATLERSKNRLLQDCAVERLAPRELVQIDHILQTSVRVTQTDRRLPFLRKRPSGSDRRSDPTGSAGRKVG